MDHRFTAIRFYSVLKVKYIIAAFVPFLITSGRPTYQLGLGFGFRDRARVRISLFV